MLKYTNYDVVFQEIPDEVSLAINLSNCPNNCPGCHSPYLLNDVGEELSPSALDGLVNRYASSITCVCFMGGDAAPQQVANLADALHQSHPHLRVGWYSGKDALPDGVNTNTFDYIKIGRYDASLGPLSSTTTNQRMLKRNAQNNWDDITHRFRKGAAAL